MDTFKEEGKRLSVDAPAKISIEDIWPICVEKVEKVLNMFTVEIPRLKKVLMMEKFGFGRPNDDNPSTTTVRKVQTP